MNVANRLEPVSATVHPTIDPAPKSIGKPGLGALENVALGVMISLVEASIADTIYKDAAETLNGLLEQIAKNDEADEKEWQAIGDKLKEIANMKQSWLGYLGEFMSYGQGSLPEQQAMEMVSLALDLARKHGYKNVRTLGDWFDGRFGHFERNQ